MTLSRRTAFAAVSAAAISLIPALAVDATGDRPVKGWSNSESIPQEYEFGTTQAVTGKCAFIKARTSAPTGNATLRQEIAADNYRGQRLRLSAQIETDNAARAVLWMRVDGANNKSLGWYGMEDKPVSGTTGWTPYNVVLDVPSDAVGVAFGYNLRGAGMVCARDFKLEPVDKDVPVSAPSNKALPNAPVNMDFAQ